MNSSITQSAPKFSIITACLPSRSEHLADTAASVRAAKEAMPLEWVLVIDGPGDVVAVDADIQLRLPRRCGISAARNVGLANASGDLIVPLDADD
ncbi:MAG: glycosyltransferase family 2 protein, partial [Angustibacter sp.]